ncbi:MAG: UV DNA damage repair endonuclease UvsE [Bacteroidota bacterium]|nr:UV DNA damage repair endonuclease UvsE [Bacteroidota bacterium]
MRVGYACINVGLAKEKVQVNRSMVKKTFLAKGTGYVSELVLKNLIDFSKIIDWNIENNILLYRMSSDMFPWMSEYEFEELPDFVQIKNIMACAGEKLMAGNLRLTFHPGPFDVLATNNTKVLHNTIKDLRQHGEIMDLLGLPQSPFAKINVHVGGAYGDKNAAINRFSENFQLLPECVKRRLTVENDDKINMYSVKDLLEIHERTGVPIVFDYLHHQFCTGGWTEDEAMMAALATWPEEIVPIVHFSSSKKKFEDKSSTAPAHADYIYSHVKRYGKVVDIMFEAKAKELAVLRYVSEYKVKLV